MSGPDTHPNPLVAMLAPGGFSHPDLESVLVRWIALEFLDDQHAQLDSLGVSPERKVRLAHVFVDLAAGDTDGRAEHTPPETFPETPPEPGLLATLLAEPTCELDEAGIRRTQSRHTLVIGGPGQGKTTLVQYLCQIHRAFILQHYRPVLEGPELEALAEVCERSNTDGLTPGVQPCVPLFIVLRDLAAWLARHPTVPTSDALLAHLLTGIQQSTGTTVECADLVLLLKRGAWLLVLDGLDEVPSAGGRSHTLSAVQAFVERFDGTIRQIVATTRPQGYSGEFQHYESRRLAPLSLHRALWYARELVKTWFPDEQAARKRLLDRVLQAAREEATARLMQSPLQITIMAVLLDRVARAPHERWRLYKLYFNTIYDRELGRRSDAAEILRTQRPHIEAIHIRAGLHLQVACEVEGATAALLSRDALLAIVHARLVEQYTDEARRSELAEAIMDVAANRLVFLVSPQSGFYGFELRSLQEFMAAEAIMNGREQTVSDCIQCIARSESWRNVLLFAISHCFANSHPLTEVFTINLCEQLDTDRSDPSAVTLHLGSRLALDILQEGSALYYPAITLRLLARALSWLPYVEYYRMADVLAKLHAEADLSAGTARLVVEALRPSVTAQDNPPDNGWALLNAACALGIPGAEELATTAWAITSNVQKQAILTQLAFPIPLSLWFTRTLASDLTAINPWDLLGHQFSRPVHEVEIEAFDRISMVNRCRGSECTVQTHYLPVSIMIHYIDPERVPAPLSTPDTASWRALARAVEFTERPSAQTLANAIRAIRATDDLDQVIWHVTPWPLACALEAAESIEDLELIANRAESGALGDRAEWLAAQERWSTQGLVRKDFEAYANSGCLPHPGMARAGFPFRTRFGIHFTRRDPNLVTKLSSLYQLSKSPQARGLFSYLLSNARHFDDVDDVVDDADDVDDTDDVVDHADVVDDADDVDDLPLVIFSRGPFGFIPFSILNRAFSGRVGERHFDALDQFARSAGAHFSFDEVWRNTESGRRLAVLLANRLRHDPSKSGLRRVLITIALRLPDLPQEVDEALATEDAGDWAGRTSNFTWRLSRASVSLNSVGIWAEQFVALGDDLRCDFHQNLELVLYRLPSEVAEALLVASLSGLEDARSLRRHAFRLLSNFREKRRSGLHDVETWRALNLPEPPPNHEIPLRADEDVADDAPYCIDSLLVTNIRAFERFELLATPPDEGHGQWIILVGENGVGKTTLLRALALALTTHANASVALSKLSSLMRRSASVLASIEVISRSQRHSVAVVGEKASEIVKRENGDPQRPFLLVAYGCRRGSAIGGPDRALLTEPIHDIHTLFDDTEFGLNHAETWLQRLAHRALEDSNTAAHVIDTVKEVLKRILPGVEMIHIDSHEVCLEGSQIGRTRLAGLSDGYVTTLGWICDLMARWIHRMEQRNRPIPPNFPEHMTGLVLIDEIDLHLHPRWQLRVIDDVRQIFPRLSFVATTHNPLTLLGAQAGELHVLRAGDRSGVVEALQLDLVKGLRADQVLTGVWFGVASTVDPDTIRLMQQHREKIRCGAVLGDSSVAEIEAEIRKRLGHLSATPLEQLVAVWRDATVSGTPEAQAAVKRDIRELALRRKALRRDGSSDIS